MLSLALFHHKTASRWVRGILRTLAAGTGRRYRNFGVLVQSELDAVLGGACRAYDLSTIGNPDYTLLAALPDDYCAFHVFRDPRDFVVSSYYSHRYSHPIFADLARHRRRLETLPVEDGILLDMDWTEQNVGYLGRIARWDFSNDRIIDVRMEDLVAAPALRFPALLKFIGFEVEPGALREVLAEHTFEKLSGGRSPGQERADSHYRNGVAGAWRRYFTARVRAAFAARHGDLPHRLGYAP